MPSKGSVPEYSPHPWLAVADGRINHLPTLQLLRVECMAVAQPLGSNTVQEVQLLGCHKHGLRVRKPHTNRIVYHCN